jgi:hypothetical protein
MRKLDSHIEVLGHNSQTIDLSHLNNNTPMTKAHIAVLVWAFQRTTQTTLEFGFCFLLKVSNRVCWLDVHNR